MESKKSKSSSSSRHRRRSDSSEERSHKSSSKRKNHSSNESSDSDNDNRKRSHKKDKKISSKASKTEDSGGHSENLSLSIDETNKLRAKLGLKPLSVDESNKEKPKQDETGKKTFIDKDTNQEFEHAPAKNLSEIKEQKEFKHKLEEQRERRRLAEKIREVKPIADESDSDSESTDTWVQKLKQKQEAAKKAKSLEEMDEQFSHEPEVKHKKYTASNLKGIRVEHDQMKFREGEEIILTLKDRNIVKGIGENLELDQDEDADVLVNVNIMDDERAQKNVDLKKKKPEYKPYEDFDEDGNFPVKSILDKYDEELNGLQKKSFRLGAKGMYDASDDKFIQKLEQEHKSKAIRLDILNELRESSDYMTTQEMEKFKKPKKIRKVLRKNKNLKADDLLPLPTETEDEVKPKVKIEVNTKNKGSEFKQKTVDLDSVDFGFENKNESSDEGEIRSSDEESDIDLDKIGKSDDLKEILEQENQLFEELHVVLAKTRKRITNSILNNRKEMKLEVENTNVENSTISFDNLNTVKDEEMDEETGMLTMDTISEFCRGIGSEVKAEEETMETSFKKKEESSESDGEEEEEFNLSDVEAEVANEKHREEEEEELGANILDEEPIIDRGIGSCLKLAVNKGYLLKDKDKQNAKLAKSSIEAQNYTVEERNFYDIDDKYKRGRDKFSGPLTDFEEKKGYKPDIKLDYFDEKGHAMNEKEAFRYLSHKFHGKGPGKKKTEKRLIKFKEGEAMNKMSSVDTPLNTVELMIEKQKRLQQPYVVLSAQKGKQDQVTLHKR